MHVKLLSSEASFSAKCNQLAINIIYIVILITVERIIFHAFYFANFTTLAPSWKERVMNIHQLHISLNLSRRQCMKTQWATSLFGLVFRWVFSLSPNTNLTPEFWSQSEVRIRWAETGAKIATKNAHIVDFCFTRKIFIQIFIICCFALH